MAVKGKFIISSDPVWTKVKERRLTPLDCAIRPPSYNEYVLLAQVPAACTELGQRPRGLLRRYISGEWEPLTKVRRKAAATPDTSTRLFPVHDVRWHRILNSSPSHENLAPIRTEWTSGAAFL